jgi:hypothetical protein
MSGIQERICSACNDRHLLCLPFMDYDSPPETKKQKQKIPHINKLACLPIKDVCFFITTSSTPWIDMHKY